MASKGMTSSGAQVLLTLALLALVSSGVVNVVLAVTESVLWPMLPGVGWPVIAAVLTGMASAATPSRPDDRLTEPALDGVILQAHLG